MCCDWNAFLTSEQASNRKNIFLTIKNRIKHLKYYQKIIFDTCTTNDTIFGFNFKQIFI